MRDVHVVGFESLARFQRAAVLALDPAHGPAALSGDLPPLATLLTAPFTLVPALLTSFAAVPVVSAVFAAATMVVLNTAMRRAGLGTVARAVGLLVVGFNPLVLLYAADGDRLFLGLCFALGAVSSVLAWRAASDVRFLLAAGLAFALAVMCDYDMLAWLVVTVITVGATLVRLGARGDEVESTVVALGLPTLGALGLWVVFGLVVTGRPFGWLAAIGRDPLVPLPTGDQVELSGALLHTGSLVLHGAPLAAVVLPALLYRWLVRRDPWAGVLAALLATVAMLPGFLALLGRSGPPQLRDAVPILLVSVLCAVWLVAGSSTTWSSRLVGTVALAVLAVSLPWTFRAMSTYDDQVLEAGFADAVRTGRSQEGTLTTGGQQVGYASEAAMARWIRTHVTRPGSILTDDAATYAVLLPTASPGLFRDTPRQQRGAVARAGRRPCRRRHRLPAALHRPPHRPAQPALPLRGHRRRPPAAGGAPHPALRAGPGERRDGRPAMTGPHGITPPPPLHDVLDADAERLGRVDFSGALGSQQEPTSEVTPDDDVPEVAAQPQVTAQPEPDDEPAAPPRLRAVGPTELPVQAPAQVSAPESEPVSPVGGLGAPEDQLRHLALSVDAVAASVITRMREAGEANRRHLEALEAEAARRYELLTAQAELDAELIRLHARREAYAIITAARMRSGELTEASEESRRLDEVGESFARFTEAFQGPLDHPDDPYSDPGLR